MAQWNNSIHEEKKLLFKYISRVNKSWVLGGELKKRDNWNFSGDIFEPTRHPTKKKQARTKWAVSGRIGEGLCKENVIWSPEHWKLKAANLELMELENIVANTVYLKAREGELFNSVYLFIKLTTPYWCEKQNKTINDAAKNTLSR